MNFSSRGYYFAVKAYDKYGNQSLVSNSAMAYSGYSRYDTAWVAVDVTETPIPDRFALYQNYPNPFNPLTQIEFDISESGSVTLRIYNILGQEVTCLLEKNMAPGRYTVQWNTRGLASGLYFYRLQQGQNSQVRKMLLLR